MSFFGFPDVCIFVLGSGIFVKKALSVNCRNSCLSEFPLACSRIFALKLTFIAGKYGVNVRGSTLFMVIQEVKVNVLGWADCACSESCL